MVETIEQQRRRWMHELWIRWFTPRGGRDVTLVADEARELEKLLGALGGVGFPAHTHLGPGMTSMERARSSLEAACWFLQDNRRNATPGQVSKDGNGQDHRGAAQHALTCVTMALEDLMKVVNREDQDP